MAKKYSVLHQGSELNGLIEKIKGQLWVHLNGETFAYTPKKPSWESLGKSAESHGNLITAPMPGKIKKVNFLDGQSIKSGEVGIVMEAMKMEYSLKAKIDGQVKKILCSVGDQVTLGQTLVQLENTEESD